MVGRRAASLGSSDFHTAGVERQPFRPVSAQFKEVIEVNETTFLEIVDQLRQHIARRKGPQNDEALLEPKLIGGKIVPVVDRATRYSAALERALTDEDDRVIVRKLQRHDICSIRD